MVPSQHLKQIESRIVSMQKRPRVGVFIDLDGVLADRDDLQDETISKVSWDLACSVGRLCGAVVYYSTAVLKNDSIDDKAWAKRSIKTVHTTDEGFTRDDLNLDLMFEVHAAVMHKQFDTVILMVGTTDYSKLAQRLIYDGVSIVIVSNYPPEKRMLPKHSCIYVPMHTLLMSNVAEEEEGDVFDPDGFDYASLIRLLATSEDMMPFVAVSYFVKRVMWRLGNEFQEYRLCQELFQTAKDRGIIEIYERDNINNGSNKVSACKLNQEHSLVVEVMENLEEATHAREGVKVTVNIGDSPTDSVITDYSAHPTA